MFLNNSWAKEEKEKLLKYSFRRKFTALNARKSTNKAAKIIMLKKGT